MYFYRFCIFIIFAIFLPFQCSSKSFKINVNTTNVIAEVELSFLSLAIDADIIAHFGLIDFTSSKLLSLCRGFSINTDQPEIYLRIGGTAQDNIVWQQSSVDDTSYILNATEWDLINNFATKLTWKLVFGLNSLQRRSDNSWDPTNAIKLMRYTTSKGYNVNFELGNEPDLYLGHRNISIPPSQLSRDFALLWVVLLDELRGAPLLIGPDVATLNRDDYFQKYLSNLEDKVLNAVTFHHYYGPSKSATLQNFTDPKYLDTFITYAAKARDIIRAAPATKDLPIWIGETSSTYGGGAPGLSDSFVAGFLWLDKLGIAAQMDFKVVIRQALVGGHYSLLDKYLDPNPDYWLSILHKHLVGRKVLNITGSLTMNRTLRLYAHCANEFGGMGYNKGAVTIAGMNLDGNFSADVTFTDPLAGLPVDQYLLQPTSGYLFDKTVSLNGKPLILVDGTTLPSIKPIQVEQPIKLPPYSLGFFVIPDAKVEVCL